MTYMKLQFNITLTPISAAGSQSCSICSGECFDESDFLESPYSESKSHNSLTRRAETAKHYHIFEGRYN